MPKQINLQKELSKFFFSSKIRVRFHQVDALGILYNVQYLIIFENARHDYLTNLGLYSDLKDIIYNYPVMTANHRIDYLNFAEFGDEIEIFSRVSHIGNSSLIFENLAIKNGDTIIAKSSTAFVYINPITRKSTPIPKDLKQKFLEFERGNIILTSQANEKI